MELEGKREAFQKRGLGLAAISNDTLAILKHFGTRRHISFPLLSDPQSVAIKAFNAVNPNADGAAFGGTVTVDAKGMVASKYFEEEPRERTSFGTILLQWGDPPVGAADQKTDHFALRTSLSALEAYPQQRVTLVLDFQMGENRHVYAPSVKGYRPLNFRLQPHALVTVRDASYPAPKSYVFKPLKETLPIFDGAFRVTRDVTLNWGREMYEFLKGPNPTITLEGAVDYQVCSDRVCFAPASLPVRWTIKVLPFDDVRVPENLRKTP